MDSEIYDICLIDWLIDWLIINDSEVVCEKICFLASGYDGACF